MNKWLTIVGMGEDGYDGLPATARLALQHANHIIGSSRLLGFLPLINAQKHEWPQPFSAVVEQIKPLRGQATVVLATGDPMNFGAARKLLTLIPLEETSIIPHISAFSIAAARLGWSLPDCDCLTIHGRSAANLEAWVQPGARLLVLTQDATSVAECAQRMMNRGFENSEMFVLENLGGPREFISQMTVDRVPQKSWSDLNTIAIHCVASPNARIWSRVPGLPDEAFEHDGKMTKREVRATTLAALSPAPDQLLWDVGAGCGSVSIEWMRSTRGCEAIAIEPDENRRTLMSRNADGLGTPRLQIIAGTAPDALEGLATPDAIFIGGGLDTPGVFEAAWLALKSGGTCVANAVTLEGERHLITLQEKYGGDLVRMDVSTLTHIGELRALRPRMSVLQWRTRKAAR
jgi:precorrin-6B C5,15-methyltransferase / cobalt-precorrin-6B C5,C15-methyltransferase